MRCLRCGKDFKGRKNYGKKQRYCSVQCANRKYQEDEKSVICIQCNKTFHAEPANKRKFCSQECYWQWRRDNHKGGRKGIPLTKEHKLKISIFMKGNKYSQGRVPWNEGLTKEDPRVMKYTKHLSGRTISDLTKAKLRNINLGRPSAFKGKRHTDATKEKLRKLRLKQVFPSKRTTIEVRLQEILLEAGIPFLVQVPIMGLQPDIILVDAKVAIFCDGCYWHACPIHEPITLRDFSSAIGRKRIQRVTSDKMHNKLLLNNGWRVVRFWEHEITKAASKDQILFRIKEVVENPHILS